MRWQPARSSGTPGSARLSSLSRAWLSRLKLVSSRLGRNWSTSPRAYLHSRLRSTNKQVVPLLTSPTSSAAPSPRSVQLHAVDASGGGASEILLRGQIAKYNCAEGPNTVFILICVILNSVSSQNIHGLGGHGTCSIPHSSPSG